MILTVRSAFEESRTARALLRDCVAAQPIEVEVLLDEDELFDVPHRSGRRLKVGGGVTRAFAPSTAVLDAMALDADDDEVTRVSLEEVRRRLAVARRRA